MKDEATFPLIPGQEVGYHDVGTLSGAECTILTWDGSPLLNGVPLGRDTIVYLPISWRFKDKAGIFEWPPTFEWDRTIYYSLSVSFDGWDYELIHSANSIETPNGYSVLLLNLRDFNSLAEGIPDGIMATIPTSGLTEGLHTAKIELQVFAKYWINWGGGTLGWYFGYMSTETEAITFNVTSAAPVCGIGCDKTSCEAPCDIEFWDNSTSYWPILASWWNFQDGSPWDFNLDPGIHRYEKGKTRPYIVLHGVRNQYASDQCTIEINIAPYGPRPDIDLDRCRFPAEAHGKERFPITVCVENRGGEGWIWVKVTARDGNMVMLGSNYYISAEGQPSSTLCLAELFYDVYWYMGYWPTKPMYLKLTFECGLVGEDTPSGAYMAEITYYPDVIPEPCTDDSDCNPGFMCDDGVCVPVEEPAPKAGLKTWLLIAGGTLVAIGGVALLRKK